MLRRDGWRGVRGASSQGGTLVASLRRRTNVSFVLISPLRWIAASLRPTCLLFASKIELFPARVVLRPQQRYAVSDRARRNAGRDLCAADVWRVLWLAYID